jgi:hypothetical protein
MLFIHSFINSRRSPNFPKPHTRIRRLSQNLRQIESLPKTYTHTHTHLTANQKAPSGSNQNSAKKKERKKEKNRFSCSEHPLGFHSRNPKTLPKKKRRSKNLAASLYLEMTDPWPCCSSPVGAAPKSRRSSNLSHRGRERDDKGELRPKETQESQKRHQNRGYFAQQKRPVSFSHR